MVLPPSSRDEALTKSHSSPYCTDLLKSLFDIVVLTIVFKIEPA